MIYFDSYTLWLIVTPWRLVTEPWRHESPCGCCGCSSALAPKMRSRAAWWKMVKSSAILRNPEESSGDNHDIPWLIWTITLGLLYLYWCELMWIDVNIWESKIQKIQDSHFWNLGSKVSKSPPSHNRKSEQSRLNVATFLGSWLGGHSYLSYLLPSPHSDYFHKYIVDIWSSACACLTSSSVASVVVFGGNYLIRSSIYGYI